MCVYHYQSKIYYSLEGIDFIIDLPPKTSLIFQVTS